MTKSLVTGKRDVRSRTKVKTGCATCRIRKIKCDETKPSCRKCVDTGRACDGYDSPFRIKVFTSPSVHNAHASGAMIRSGAGFQLPSLQPTPTLVEISLDTITLLNRSFSTKTMLDATLACDEEAGQILQASLTDPPIRHAVSSLLALRGHLETTGAVVPFISVARQTRSRGCELGIQQYCLALGGLASTLSRGSGGGRSALLCCQVFIGIEQVRGNYAAMARHIVRGLGVMREYRSRWLGWEAERVPLLDGFVVKLFAAPCRFADPPGGGDGATGRALGARGLRMIAPDIRAELVRVAASTLEFLGSMGTMSHVGSPGDSVRLLLAEKAFLLDSLELWLVDFERVHPDGSGPISVSFLRLFHQVLKVVVMGAVNSCPDVGAGLQIENDRLQGIADSIEERVKGVYGMGGGTGI